MVWTITKTPTVFGNQRAVMLKCTADAATQSVETGLKKIIGISSHYGSAATIVGPKAYINSNPSGVATDGVIGCSGFSSGDDVYFVVYGN